MLQLLMKSSMVAKGFQSTGTPLPLNPIGLSQYENSEVRLHYLIIITRATCTPHATHLMGYSITTQWKMLNNKS